MAVMNGAQMLIKALEDEGVSTIFGLPGGTVLDIYDALRESQINHILMRHEQAASHAADGYGRAGGKPGVCLATSGPGATNLVTGIATANLDSAPLVAITGQVSSSVIGTDAFQEADIIGACIPLVKHSFQVRSAELVQQAVHKAFYIASSGRPGPVLIDVPADVQKQKGEYSFSSELNFRGYRLDKLYDVSRMDEALDLLRSAERPLIFAGGGVIRSGASEILTELALKYMIPVATTLLGKGSFPESHGSGLSLGMAGMHGHPVANRAIMNADVILAIGTRFSDRTTGNRQTFAKDAKIIHIDVDAAEVDKVIDADISLFGDASRVLETIVSLLGKTVCHDEWLARLSDIRTKEPLPRPVYNGGIAPWHVFEALHDITDGNAVVTTEVGLHQMWAAQHLRTEAPGRFITSGGLGTMGFGFPAAIGAAFACKNQPVVCIAGDASLLMNIQELDTCARYNIPVKIIVVNNVSLGNVRMFQEFFCGKRYFSTICSRSPNFVQIAEAMGVRGFEVHEPEKVYGAVSALLGEDGPALLDVRIPQYANVTPMVSPGDTLNNMMM